MIDYGKYAYEHYDKCMAEQGVCVDAWESLDDTDKKAWTAAAVAVRELPSQDREPMTRDMAEGIWGEHPDDAGRKE